MAALGWEDDQYLRFWQDRIFCVHGISHSFQRAPFEGQSTAEVLDGSIIFVVYSGSTGTTLPAERSMYQAILSKFSRAFNTLILVHLIPRLLSCLLIMISVHIQGENSLMMGTWVFWSPWQLFTAVIYSIGKGRTDWSWKCEYYSFCKTISHYKLINCHSSSLTS